MGLRHPLDHQDQEADAQRVVAEHFGADRFRGPDHLALDGKAADERGMEALEQMEECNWSLGDTALGALKNLLQECMDKGLIQKAPVEAAAMAIWGMVHGLVSLAIRNRMNKLVPKEKLLSTMQQSLNWLLGAIDNSIKKK